MKTEQNEKSWIPTIRVTTLLYILLVAMAGGYLGAEYQALKSAADMQVLQEAGFVNKAQTVSLPKFADIPYNQTAEYKQLKQKIKDM